MIFYFHPSTTTAALFFRTVPILPEGSGRVAEVNVGSAQAVKKGDVLFRLDSSKQEAALETAKRKIAEVDAIADGGESRRRQGRGSDRGGESAPTSRPRTNWIPKASCNAAIPASCRSATSRSFR